MGNNPQKVLKKCVLCTLLQIYRYLSKSQSPLCWSGDKIDWRHRQKWSLCWQAVLVLFQGVVEKRDKIFYGVVLVSDLEWVWMGVWFLQFSRLAWPLFDLGLDIAAAALPRFRNPPTSKLGTWVIYNISRIPWPKSQMLFQNQNPWVKLTVYYISSFLLVSDVLIMDHHPDAG